MKILYFFFIIEHWKYIICSLLMTDFDEWFISLFTVTLDLPKFMI